MLKTRNSLRAVIQFWKWTLKNENVSKRTSSALQIHVFNTNPCTSMYVHTYVHANCIM
jgi:hypothetical protein